MEKITLLVNELDKIKKGNLIKFMIMEVFILILTIGSFFTNLTLTYQLILFFVFLLLFIFLIIIYHLKLKFISKLKNTYINNHLLFINVYNNRKSKHLDILDNLNEKLIFEEIIRVINIKDKFHDQGKLGPWEIIYNHHKTQKFYQNYQMQNKIKINKAKQLISSLDNETIELLDCFGVDYKKVFDFWGNELMYPIYGILVNDSQVLRHGLIHKEYQVNDKIMIKPYEKKLLDEDVIMLHVKIKSR